jgi:ABC-type dipeptide/oligopeptide/nickel transport system permease subunit
MASAPDPPRRTAAARALRRGLRGAGTSGRAGLAIVVAFVALALLAPLCSPYDPRAYTGDPLLAPSAGHWLGTNDLGQDILSELLWGARTSVAVGLTVGLLSTLAALYVALVAGVHGGRVDRALMRVVDAFLAVPRLPFIIVLAAYLGASIWNLILVLALFSWAKGARVIRAQVLSLMTRTHVEAARLFGASRAYLITRHILPEVAPLAAYKLIKTSSYALVAEAGLAFLGIGDPSTKSWGMMFYHVQSRPEIYYTGIWLWWFLPPALCLVLLVLGLVLLQHGMERLVDPSLQPGGGR